MTKDYIYKDIIQLDTPVGYYCVIGDDGKIPFSVENNLMDSPYELFDDNDKVIGTISTDTNYCIVIDAKLLQIGKNYTVKFVSDIECKWEYCDSDEQTTCFNTVINDWVVGIGAYDPNDQEKVDQAWKYSKDKGYLDKKYIMHPPQYDKTNFRKYEIEVLDSLDGYKFKLLENSVDRVSFHVAWIKVEEYKTICYEGALGLWLC